jgi:hypothetical protein
VAVDSKGAAAFKEEDFKEVADFAVELQVVEAGFEGESEAAASQVPDLTETPMSRIAPRHYPRVGILAGIVLVLVGRVTGRESAIGQELAIDPDPVIVPETAAIDLPTAAIGCRMPAIGSQIEAIASTTVTIESITVTIESTIDTIIGKTRIMIGTTAAGTDIGVQDPATGTTILGLRGASRQPQLD